MKLVKKPLFIALVAAALLTIVGAVMGWFTIGSPFVRLMAEDQLAKKQTLAVAITILSLAITAGAVLSKKQRAVFVAVVISVYGLIMIINQKPEPEIVQKIALTVNPGYWMGLAGTLVMIVAGCIIGAKGIDAVSIGTKNSKDTSGA